jgi:hypothetical protein
VSERKFDPVSFVVGIAMIALAMSWLIGGDDAYLAQHRFVWPIALMGVGVALLVSRARRS